MSAQDQDERRELTSRYRELMVNESTLMLIRPKENTHPAVQAHGVESQQNSRNLESPGESARK